MRADESIQKSTREEGANEQGSNGLESLHRLTALSDGIFAFAMTVLVIDVRLPDDLRAGGTSPIQTRSKKDSCG
jgi:hypothetical protein